MPSLPSISDFQAKTGYLVQDTGSHPGALDPTDTVFQATPTGLTKVTYAAALDAYQAALAPQPVPLSRTLTRAFNDEIKALIKGQTGDVPFWSKTTKRVATIGAEYLTNLALSVDPTVSRAIAPQRARLEAGLRKAAFDGNGELDYWIDRCWQTTKDAAAVAFEISDVAERAVATQKLYHPSTVTLHHPGTKSISARCSNYYATAQSLAQGTTDNWSYRTKQLAFETMLLTADIAAQLGVAASPKVRDVIARIHANTYKVAFDGLGSNTYWSTRCKELCSSNTDLIKELEQAI
jgi:hypothetical protein